MVNLDESFFRIHANGSEGLHHRSFQERDSTDASSNTVDAGWGIDSSTWRSATILEQGTSESGQELTILCDDGCFLSHVSLSMVRPSHNNSADGNGSSVGSNQGPSLEKPSAKQPSTNATH